MIDMHTHILPEIDDGATNVEIALQMTEALYQQGVKSAVCTPHFDPTQISIEKFALDRKNALTKLVTTAIKLIPASETALHEYLFHYNDLSILCIENTNYLLVEMPFDRKWDDSILEMLNKLITYYGIIPVIAHMERYPAMKRHRKYINQIIDMGCITQANTTSVMNKKSRNRMLKYIKNGMIDVLGSDCHDMVKRPPLMDSAFELIKLKLGNRYLEILEQNSECIVNGIDLRKKKSYIIE